MERRPEYRQLVEILAMFLIVQFAGLLLIFYSTPLPSQVVAQAATPQAQSGAVVTAVTFMAVILIGTAIFMLLFRVSRGALLFKLIEGYVIVGGTFYFCLALFGNVVQQALPLLALSLGLGFALAAAKNKWQNLRNFVVVVSSIGVGIALGTAFGPFGFITAYIFMAILSVYDYVAVFVTKHMVSLAKEVVSRNLAFMVGASGFELVPRSYLKKDEVKRYEKLLKPGSVKSREIRRLIERGAVPVPSFHALGAGDLVAPLMLAGSAYITFLSYFTGISIAIASVFGLLANMLVLLKYRTVLPAIPPIFAFSSFAVGLEYAFNSPSVWQVYAALIAMGVVTLGTWLLAATRQSRRSLV